MHLFQKIKVLDKAMLRKIFFFLLTVILLLPFFAINAPLATAEGPKGPNCQIVATREENGKPLPADDTDTQINLIVTYDINSISEPVELYLKKHEDAGQYRSIFNNSTRTISNFTPDNTPDPNNPGRGKIRALGIYKYGDTYSEGISTKPKPYKAGDYDVKVVPAGFSQENSYCTVKFNLKNNNINPGSSRSTKFCKVELLQDNDYTIDDTNPVTNVGIKVEFFEEDSNPNDTKDTHHHRIFIDSRFGRNNTNSPTTTELESEWHIPNDLRPGTYNIIVKEHAYDKFWEEEGRECGLELPFLIDTKEHGGGHVCTPDNNADCNFDEIKFNQPVALPCNKNGPDYDPKFGCTRIHTAIGDVNTQANDFVKWVLGFVLGISGGIVLIIIIISGYRLMTSQGDPEKVKNARDQLTAAIVGLLFIIFSLVILQLITQDILQIPGFGSP